MGYLIPSDYKKQIQVDNLNQITGSDPSVKLAAENTAIGESKSYLVQKYNLAQELQDTPVWDITKTYYAGNRVYLNPDAFDSSKTYTAGQYVTVDAVIYKSISGSAPRNFLDSQWTLVNLLAYQMFYAPYPQPIFSLQGFYNVGDQVFWKDNIYTCKIATAPISQSEALQFGNYSNLPYQNIFPDDTANGMQYWGIPTPFVIPGNTDIQNALWSVGDNRDQQLVTYLVDITLYHLHSRISPSSIPDLRVKRYDDAIKWLKMCAKGDVTAAIPVLQPSQGLRVRWGGNVKNVNSY